MLVDMTEVKQTEGRLKLLVREIDHRGNNLLAVISAAVNLTDADDVPAFRKAVLGRIQALANSQRLLSQSHWQRAKLRDIFDSELAPYGKERCRIEGGDIGLKPAIAQAFAIVIHELATNAAKYGALSEPDGRVTVSWALENDGLKVRWSESSGPQILGPPQRKGFGTTAVSATVKYTLKGKLGVEWLPEGLRCVISLPRSRLQPAPGDELTASLAIENI